MATLSSIHIRPQIIFFITLLFGLMMISQNSEAKRFGGGSSFGYQKQVAPKQYKTAPSKTAPKQTSSTQTKPASGAAKWLGPLAGIAAGGLLAAMLFGDGFEGIQLFDILLFALIAFVLFKIFAGRARTQQAQYQQTYSDDMDSRQSGAQAYRENVAVQQQYRRAHSGTPQSAEQQGSIIGADLEDGIGQGVSGRAEFLDEIPAWFDAESFVQGAKGHFVTLQKAWDNVDLSELESYCTADLFSALQKELQGVQPGDNHTVVDSLDAEIAAMAVDGGYLVVSVRFSGFIEEDAAGAHAFSEIWHIRRLASDEGDWKVAGIQQANEIA